MIVDQYRTLADSAAAEITVDRSRFIGHSIPLSSEETFQAELAALAKWFFDATHLCWAWRIADNASAPVADRFLYTRFRIEVPFPQLNHLYRMLSPPSVVLVSETFGETNVFELDVRRSEAGRFSKELKNLKFRIQNSESG